jgi:hypothetical protein
VLARLRLENPWSAAVVSEINDSSKKFGIAPDLSRMELIRAVVIGAVSALMATLSVGDLFDRGITVRALIQFLFFGVASFASLCTVIAALRKNYLEMPRAT